nr:hypothetical protein [Tanacetum cinerariifolium]
MYSIDLNNIVPHKNLTCLVAKALVDESMLWHRRLGHRTFKTMNKLLRNNLVKGLPSKCFENDHTYVAYLKEKQNKAFCKTKLVNSVSKPLHTLHMDLFGPTSDETSSILRNFITKIENLKDLKVKIIRCDNGGEFKNQEMNEFCTKKGIKREFSNARTSQQNRIAERRNRTLIEAARTMLADAKLSYHLGKFDAKGDEGYFVGYSLSSKAFRVFNKRTKNVEENLHVDFLENKLIEKGAGPNWLFDNDTLTNSMNYVPVVVAGTSSTNISGIKDVASQAVKKDVSSLRYIALPNWFHEAYMETSNDTIMYSDAHDDSQKEQDCNADVPESMEYEILTVSSPVPTICLDISPESSSDPRLISKGAISQKEAPSLVNALTFSNRFEDTFGDTTNAVTLNEVEADLSNMETSIPMDVKSAFLYGTIDEVVYVMQPLRFQDPEFPNRVYKVEKAMYGIHQAPRAWYGTLSKYLLDNGFQRGTIDQTLFIKKHKGEFFSCPSFQMSAMGKLTFFLVLQVLQKKDGIFLSQDKYVGDILKKFGYSDISDYDGATQDRKSTTGGCQFLGRRLISWQCKKQTIVTTFTTKAEYVAAASGCGQVLWIQNQMLDYGYNFINKHNTDFHQIVDFLEASHISYALTLVLLSMFHIFDSFGPLLGSKQRIKKQRLLVKGKQEKDKIETKPDKNEKCGDARQCQSQSQSRKKEKN